jgi:hypothetical protein
MKKVLTEVTPKATPWLLPYAAIDAADLSVIAVAIALAFG